MSESSCASQQMQVPLIEGTSVEKQEKKSFRNVGEFLKADSGWNTMMWLTGAFHYPLFDLRHSPAASLVQLIACLGFLVQSLICVYDLWANVNRDLTIAQIAYVIGDVVILIQNTSIIVGILYAVERIRQPFGSAGNRSAAGEIACFEYAMKKCKVFIGVAVLMFTFTGCVITYNGYTQIDYDHSFVLSLCAVVASLVASNLLSLWMMVFIWVDTEASDRVVASAVSAAGDGTLSVARYCRKLAQFRSRMANIGSLMDFVVIVAYINTLAFGLILLVCPPPIALSYISTFGREPVILLLTLPAIAAVNDRHPDLLRCVAESDLTDEVTAGGLRGSILMEPTPPKPPPSPRPVSASGGLNSSQIQNLDLDTLSSDAENGRAGGYDLVKSLQEQITQLRLWVAINNAPLHIPILTSKIITRDNLRTQLTGSVLFIISIVAKMLVEQYS